MKLITETFMVDNSSVKVSQFEVIKGGIEAAERRADMEGYKIHKFTLREERENQWHVTLKVEYFDPEPIHNFSVGDRVAYYQSGMRFVGTVKDISPSPYLTNSIGVLVDNCDVPNYVHHKQCRKLGKKK